MAVVNRSEAGTAQGSTNKKGYAEPIEVDLEKILAMGKAGLGTKRTLDATEDAWERSAPIPPGRYTVKAYLSKEKPKMGFYDAPVNKEPWFTLGLECKVSSNDPDINNTTIFGGVSTRINQRKNISTAAGLIAKFGFNLPPEASDAMIVALLKVALLKERPIDVEVDWKAGFKEADGSWINCANTYDDFPPNPEGGRDFVIKVEKKDKSKEEVRARLHITHWYGKDEPVGTKISTLPVGKVNGVAMPDLEESDDSGIPGLVSNNKSEIIQTVKESKPTKPPVSDEDALAALLEG